MSTPSTTSISTSTSTSPSTSTSTSPPPQPVPTIPMNFLSSPFSIPCTRTSLLWGIGTGSAVGMLVALRTVGEQKVRQFRGLAFGFGTFFIISTASWTYCRRAFNLKSRQLEQFVDVANRPLPADTIEKLKAAGMIVQPEITEIQPTTTSTSSSTTIETPTKEKPTK